MTHTNSKLLLIGCSKESQNCIILDLVKKYGLRNHVIFLGRVNNPQDFLNAADVFIFPSRIEGFAISVLEAQANGLSVIASKEAVPYEANVTKEIVYMSLSEPEESWASTALKICHKRNMKNFTTIKNSVYDLNIAAPKLYESYKKLQECSNNY